MAAFELNNTILKNSANLKAYYRFESGALTTDSSGNGKTLTNNNNITNSAGVFGYCGDGGVSNTNKYLAIQDNLGIAGNGAVSMSFWIKMNTEIASNTQVFLQHMSTLTADRYINCYYDYNAGTRRLTASFSGTNAYFNIVLGTTSWHHVVIVRDVANSVGYLVVDGVKGSTSALGTSTLGVNRLSILGAVSDSFLSGMMDDLAVFNTVLTSDQIKELYEGRTVGELWPQNGLVGLWHLNGNSTDYSPNGYNLTNNGSTTFVSGKFGQAASFNGSSQSLTIADASSANLKITGSQTWMAWCKVVSTSAVNEGTIMARCDSGSSNLFRISTTTSGTKQFYGQAITSAGNKSTGSSPAYTEGIWYHLAVVFSGTELALYVNGNKTNSTTFSSATVNSFTSQFGIGINGSSSSYPNYFNGMIDEVAVFNRALSDREIRNYYAWATGRFGNIA